jgi:hypothetical protein
LRISMKWRNNRLQGKRTLHYIHYSLYCDNSCDFVGKKIYFLTKESHFVSLQNMFVCHFEIKIDILSPQPWSKRNCEGRSFVAQKHCDVVQEKVVFRCQLIS